MTRAAIKAIFDYHEAAVDEIIASCNGDMRGAVRALMLVNEQLEQEVQQLYDAADSNSPREKPVKSIVALNTKH
jgi:hypothetical protein